MPQFLFLGEFALWNRGKFSSYGKSTYCRVKEKKEWFIDKI